MVEAVVFDLDDTLYPHVRYVHSGFAAVAHHVAGRFDLSPRDAYSVLRVARETAYRGTEFQRLCQVYGLDESMTPDLVRVYRTHQPQLWLSHGAVTVLESLRGAGCRLALLTNGPPSVQASKVRALGLEALVDHVVYANDHAENGKPAPEPFVETLSRLAVDAHDAVMVGDDPVNDVAGARAVGLRTILLARTGREPSHVADVAVHVLADVPRAVAGLVGRGELRAA